LTASDIGPDPASRAVLFLKRIVQFAKCYAPGIRA